MFHLPVRGNGDGGLYTTAADIHAFWDALLAGRIVSSDTVAEMVRPRSDAPSDSMRYGLGFWLHASTDAVSLHGFDAGAGFVSVRDPGGRFTYTVLSNKSRGAWPVSQRLEALLIQ
jgi:CubicO group peptidase (beta-lactamase class C family)